MKESTHSADKCCEEDYFEIDSLAKKHLASQDKKLSAFMDIAETPRRIVQSDPFHGLVHAIIGQQISSKAHLSVWNRFKREIPALTPQALLAMPLPEIQKLGISQRKAAYIQGIAREFASGALKGGDLAQMPDAELLERLVKIRGVGIWTGEMLLIFTFKRKNVLSYNDYAIKRGMRMLYGLADITPEFFEAQRQIYHPFATTASLYLWELASGKYPEYADSGAC